jgi:hypothetical protein
MGWFFGFKLHLIFNGVATTRPNVTSRRQVQFNALRE